MRPNNTAFLTKRKYSSWTLWYFAFAIWLLFLANGLPPCRFGSGFIRICFEHKIRTWEISDHTASKRNHSYHRIHGSGKNISVTNSGDLFNANFSHDFFSAISVRLTTKHSVACYYWTIFGILYRVYFGKTISSISLIQHTLWLNQITRSHEYHPDKIFHSTIKPSFTFLCQTL